MKLQVIDQKGKDVKNIEVSDEIFGAKVNEKVISQYVFSYLANQREGNAHTKTRAEVSGGGKKPWKQKGTGRARFGSSRVPIWRKGGVAFGPRNNRNWKKLLTKNFKKAALKSILSAKTAENMIMVVDKLEITGEEKLTNKATDILKKIAGTDKKVTIVTNGVNENVLRAFSNIEKATVISINDMNAFDVYAGGKIIFEEPSLEVISNKFSK